MQVVLYDTIAKNDDPVEVFEFDDEYNTWRKDDPAGTSVTVDQIRDIIDAYEKERNRP
jgi:hypothetical protein